MKHDRKKFLTEQSMQEEKKKSKRLTVQKELPQPANWEDLRISNDFLFGKVMQDPELCKGLLQRILPKLKIDHIEYPELQKNLQPDYDAKSIRLDLYVRDNKDTVYNIEMQVKTTGDIPKRSRYYQSIIDLQWLDKGEISYKNLNRTYIIFICLSDLYKTGRHIYTFENICKEDHSIVMGDETVKIILNAKGTQDDISQELKAFLDYVAGTKTKNGFVEKIDQAVTKAKKNREWRREYMTLQMRDQENWEEGLAAGLEAGRENGEEMMAQLIQKLKEDNRFAEIDRILQDKQYRKLLYKEYDIYYTTEF